MDEWKSLKLGDDLYALLDELTPGIEHSPLATLIRIVQEIALLIINEIDEGLPFTPAFPEFIPLKNFRKITTEFMWDRVEREFDWEPIGVSGTHGNVVFKHKRSMFAPDPEAPYLNGVVQEGTTRETSKIISLDNSNISDFMEFIIRILGQYLLKPDQDLQYVPEDRRPSSRKTSTKLSTEQYWFYKRAQKKQPRGGH